MTQQEKQWETISKQNSYWDSEKAKKIQKTESRIIIKWLKDLKLPRYDILEIGCGNGYVGREIADWLLSEGLEFTYHLTDLLPTCLEKTKENFSDFAARDKIKYSLLDIYEADKILGEKSQKIIISTGFASAASYKNAIPITSKLIENGGILISDFINHFSPLVFLLNGKKSFTRLVNLKKHMNDPNSKYYHFGRKGIKEYFGSHGLDLIKMKTVGLRRNPLIAMFRKA